MLFGKRKRIVKHILIVEDEPLTAFDNEQMLSDAGYTVVATRDRYRDAIAELDKSKVDLILSDVRLSGNRTGIDLAKEAQRRGIPVLFATGHAPEEAHKFSIGVLMKPFNERTLKAALNCVEDHLAGKAPATAPKGLTLFPGQPPQDAD